METQLAYCEGCDDVRPLTYCETCQLDLCDECQMKEEHARNDLAILRRLEHPLRTILMEMKWWLVSVVGLILLGVIVWLASRG